VIGFIEQGAVVGELAMIDGLPRSATAVAVKECVLSFIPKSAFDGCLNAHPEVYKFLVESLAARLRESNDARAAASFLHSKGRLARAMLEMSRLFGEDHEGRILIVHPIRLVDLATMAGIARENVSRILSDWNRQGIVGRSSKSFCIYKPKLLARLAGSMFAEAEPS
jgi:CRP/FNR family cyclic AMP-dependent transcriptional regulator